tara:strand:+ start:178 stop:609 length:432 start_codon:yes stop_codon:yes gene_type:complete
MNSKDFNKLRKELFEEAISLSDAKSIEYTISNEDRLYNFKNVASRVGTKPMQSLLGYVLKHMDAICNDAKTGKQFSDETFRSRCLDIICYMVLAVALHIDEQQEPQPNENNTKPDGTVDGVYERSGSPTSEPQKWDEYSSQEA